MNNSEMSDMLLNAFEEGKKVGKTVTMKAIAKAMTAYMKRLSDEYDIPMSDLYLVYQEVSDEKLERTSTQ